MTTRECPGGLRGTRKVPVLRLERELPSPPGKLAFNSVTTLCGSAEAVMDRCPLDLLAEDEAPNQYSKRCSCERRHQPSQQAKRSASRKIRRADQRSPARAAIVHPY